MLSVSLLFVSKSAVCSDGSCVLQMKTEGAFCQLLSLHPLISSNCTVLTWWSINLKLRQSLCASSQKRLWELQASSYSRPPVGQSALLRCVAPVIYWCVESLSLYSFSCPLFRPGCQVSSVGFVQSTLHLRFLFWTCLIKRHIILPHELALIALTNSKYGEYSNPEKIDGDWLVQ